MWARSPRIEQERREEEELPEEPSGVVTSLSEAERAGGGF